MVLDFGKLNTGGTQKQTEPRKLFTTLGRSAKFRRPLDEQAEVLDRWYEKRERKDNTLKMNTGAGKTLVGLLALQSSLNEGISPAVYVAPDNYLAEQVIKEARELGIAVTEEIESAEFIAGRAILVINIMRLVNGRSVFGVGSTAKIRIGSLAIDDAHACLQTVAEQFRLVASSKHPLYESLFELFKDDLSNHSRFDFLSVEAADPSAFVEVPFWNWTSKYKRVSELLHEHRNDDAIKFGYPLITPVIQLCRCVFGGKSLEIAPRCLPIDLIPSFERAQRRIYMTATLADEGILVTHFNASPESASDPIKPRGAGDMGDRMILAPQEINPSITKNEIKSLARDLSAKENVVVIVPSFKAADFWKDSAVKILDKTNISAGIEQLKNGHVGIVVFVNKYDGVDLPGPACRLLIIDGLPEIYGLVERAEMTMLEGTQLEVTKQVQRIEQGMGRGVRSSEDHCVVLLLGSKLCHRIHLPEAKEKFSPATRAQIELGIKVTEQIRGKPLAELRPVIDLCLTQDSEWLATSRNALVNAVDQPSQSIDVGTIKTREAFDLARRGDYSGACEQVQEAVNAAKEDTEKGYFKQMLAEYTNHSDPAKAQEILLSALTLNRQVTKPLAGIKYAKLNSPTKAQAAEAAQYMQNFKSANEFLLYVGAVLDDLIWSEEHTKQFESAIENVGKILGFASQRPERDTNRGPDNLWGIGNSRYFVIECKSGAQSDTISKTDSDQLSGSMNWFSEEYDNTSSATPVMIHPSKTFNKQAAPHQATRCIERSCLDSLVDALRQYAAAIATSNALKEKEIIALNLRQFGLTAADFLQKFSRQPGKQI